MDVPNALYRRYRPQTFGDLVGQAGVVKPLTGALEGDRVSHAYLFHGPRGTGKTSTARIFAKALNCTERNSIEPCNKCQSCTAITAGSSFDVVELDAASNNGVDAMRDLISGASLASPGRKKVYIIDEVHMLSTAASNALLKTLEEPPGHVVFVLATTDPQKVLPTVRSRTQRIPFKLVRPDVLKKHLENIAADAELEVDDDMLFQAVLQGNGSVRDALSALDVVAASGVAEPPLSHALVEAIVGAEMISVLKAVALAVQDGVDPRVLAEESLGQLREMFLIQMGASELVTTPDWGSRLELAQKAGPRKTVKAMDALGDAITQMRSEHDRRINLEVSLARYCKVANAA